MRAEWTAVVNGKKIIVHLSGDGGVWTWTSNGQVSLVPSHQTARDWCIEHVIKSDLESILLSCPEKENNVRPKHPLDNIALRKSNPELEDTQDDEAAA